MMGKIARGTILDFRSSEQFEDENHKIQHTYLLDADLRWIVWMLVSEEVICHKNMLNFLNDALKYVFCRYQPK